MHWQCWCRSIRGARVYIGIEAITAVFFIEAREDGGRVLSEMRTTGTIQIWARERKSAIASSAEVMCEGI